MVVVCATFAAPRLEKVAQTKEFGFLPPTSPSIVAEDLYRTAFPKAYCPSRIVIVAARDTKLTDQDKDFLDDDIDEDDDPIDSHQRKSEFREHLAQILSDARQRLTG